MFLFCGGSRNKYKALFWDGDGFMLLYKRIEKGKIQWPRSNREVRDISQRE
ncbi:IS66 family insertion sequence element accessory protein TnpB [Halolactibacillus sp. JCM 19043]|uniref:IS66 family insertion sequence element accessory protein TnpB n=1 Tax=Halolactibacillus sp. JCM 19043 TaxID=1460638 RepID=UPI0035194560